MTKILSIETSCDETAVAILDCDGDVYNPTFNVLGNALFSQIEIHKEYGGVYPNLAKREHSKNLIPLLRQALKQANLEESQHTSIDLKDIDLSREPLLYEQFVEYIPHIQIPDIDVIAVTVGPGLEPALWVGLNFAKALSKAWNKPLIPINHMEGHIMSVLLKKNTSIEFPALSLLISGGHTELVLVKDWFNYEIIGQTRDDAVGEAFDKVARMLDLPYPGGPHISHLAEEARQEHIHSIQLPRPMLNSGDFDFSFSGLKTAVLYTIKELNDLTETHKKDIAREFEDAVTEILISKTTKALKEYGCSTLIIGGGVIANTHIREAFLKLPNISLHIPNKNLTTDNAVMIGMAGYLEYLHKGGTLDTAGIHAQGNLNL